MTIEKAIETIRHLVGVSMVLTGPAQDDALKLGIEALKRLKRNRKDPVLAIFTPLPGETKE